MKVSDVYRRPPISDRKWTIPFGKFKGRTIEWLMDCEPDYLQWCVEQDMIELDHILQDEFEELNPWLDREVYPYELGESTGGIEPNSGEAWD